MPNSVSSASIVSKKLGDAISSRPFEMQNDQNRRPGF
jgi:hypothetical protein